MIYTYHVRMILRHLAQGWQLLVLILLASGTVVRAQTPGTGRPIGISFLPPSPEAASLGRYAATPVGLYTGVPQINVPLGEVSDGPLRVPLSLTYNASGNRVEEVASWVGLGWSLNAGGVVTRVVRGRADDLPRQTGDTKSFFTVANEVDYEGLFAFSERGYRYSTYLGEMSRGCYDGEPDIFYFNFNGHTGQFCFDWTRRLVVSSAKAVRIEPQFSGAAFASTITGWRITVDDGTVYRFDAVETTTQRTPNDGFKNCTVRTTGLSFASSWFLTEIKDVNAEHAIRFEYDSYLIDYGLRESETIRHSIEQWCSTATEGDKEFNISRLTYAGWRLKAIRTSTNPHAIQLEAGALRTDTVGLGGYSSNLRSLGRLSTYNPAGAEVNTFFFSYAPNNPTGRLTLAAVRRGRLNGVVSEPYYDFTYNTAVPLPADFRSKAQDHWGYYNGADNNTSLVPACNLVLPGPNRRLIRPGANREVDSVKAKAGLLTALQHATGGKTTFRYESNDYSFVNNRDLLSLNQYKKQAYNYSAATDCGEVNGQCKEVVSPVFTIRGNPADPLEAIPLTVHYQGFSSWAASQLRKAKVRIINAATNQEAFVPLPGYFDVLAGPVDATVIKLLLPGTYYLLARACRKPDFDPNEPGDHCDYAAIDVQFDDYTEPLVRKLAGGVRIKAIKDFAWPNDSQPITRVFTYADPSSAAKSTGCIYGEPTYEYLSYSYYMSDDGSSIREPRRCDFWLRLARNRTALGSTQGSLVGYRQVAVTNVKDGAAYSRTVHRFTSPVEYPDDILDELPFPPASSISFKTGLPVDQIDYRLAAGVATRVKRTVTFYSFFTAPPVRGLAVAFPATMTEGMPLDNANIYHRGVYLNYFGHAAPVRVREYTYSPTDTTSLVQEMASTYDPVGQRLLETKRHSSDGGETLTAYAYAPDVTQPSSAVSRMAGDLHVVGTPLETVTYKLVGGSKHAVAATYREYDYRQSKLRLWGERELHVNRPVTDYASLKTAAAPDGRLKEALVIDAYDAHGNVLQFHRPGDAPTARVWGYHRTFPIAEVKNATYAEVVAILGQSVVDQLADATPDDAQVRQLLAPLRTRLPRAQVTSFTHTLLVGMTSQTDPSGRATLYEYDALGRLVRTHDEQNRILSQQRYHYARP